MLVRRSSHSPGTWALGAVRGRKDRSLEPPEGVRPCDTDFRLMSSTVGREYIPVVPSPSLWCFVANKLLWKRRLLGPEWTSVLSQWPEASPQLMETAVMH